MIRNFYIFIYTVQERVGLTLSLKSHKRHAEPRKRESPKPNSGGSRAEMMVITLMLAAGYSSLPGKGLLLHFLQLFRSRVNVHPWVSFRRPVDVDLYLSLLNFKHAHGIPICSLVKTNLPNLMISSVKSKVIKRLTMQQDNAPMCIIADKTIIINMFFFQELSRLIRGVLVQPIIPFGHNNDSR